MRSTLLLLLCLLSLYAIDARPLIDMPEQLEAIREEVLWTRACRCGRVMGSLESLIHKVKEHPDRDITRQLRTLRNHIARHTYEQCASDRELLDHLAQLVP